MSTLSARVKAGYSAGSNAARALNALEELLLEAATPLGTIAVTLCGDGLCARALTHLFGKVLDELAYRIAIAEHVLPRYNILLWCSRSHNVDVPPRRVSTLWRLRGGPLW